MAHQKFALYFTLIVYKIKNKIIQTNTQVASLTPNRNLKSLWSIIKDISTSQNSDCCNFFYLSLKSVC